MKRTLRVAIADDEALIRRYFQEILTDLGHQVVVTAANGRELADQCEAARPDLIISDIRMPVMDGIDAALEISQNQSTPIILVSAFHDPDLIERAESSHVMAYLVKPIQRADLETAIAIAQRRFAQLESLQTEAADLRRSLEERKLIERAKGLLMKQTGWAEDDAFRRMQRLACDKNRKLAEIARMMLAAKSVLDLFTPESP